ncbi:MAG: hypothetical protein RI947_362 [Candidatus Parcubacteria bacterium]|jgi:large subunit ribosomal protein L13
MAQIKQSTKPVSSKSINREWHIIDMKDQVLGRSANEIAQLLQGKHKTNYVTYLDMGDNVVVINAKLLKVTGSKTDDKIYTYYSGYPGGLKEVPLKTLLDRKPSEVIRHAVSGMLPKNKLRDRRLARLHVYADEKHPHGDKITK